MRFSCAGFLSFLVGSSLPLSLCLQRPYSIRSSTLTPWHYLNTRFRRSPGIWICCPLGFYYDRQLWVSATKLDRTTAVSSPNGKFVAILAARTSASTTYRNCVRRYLDLQSQLHYSIPPHAKFRLFLTVRLLLPDVPDPRSQ